MNVYKVKISLFFGWLLSTALWFGEIKAQNDSSKLLYNQFAEQLNFRQIGPATTSGRISDIAVNPTNHAEFYVAAAYGGVWKTLNGGITFTPIFDQYEVQSIGCLAIDPNNSKILWVGTGENNNQRSVGYGNGVYKSEDGGKSFVNMGLKNSFHIGKIVINPKNSLEVWVAAYGPLWGDKGEKGIYFTKDGGKTWILLLTDDKAGFNEIHLDPFNDNVLYACAHQRRRHEWTYLGGGPQSAIYRSNDKGLTWQKLTKGIPSGDKGRITMVVSQQKPGRVTAVIEMQGTAGGIYNSDDYGASWQKVNDFYTSGNYYQEVFQDPKNDQRLFFMDTYLHFSEDGGKTVKRFPEKNKHVDNHALWIDPQNYKHLRVGCDGGLYETFDYGENWAFFENLPITQFYRVTADNTQPFYHIYGGTQDNYSIGGPSRNNTNNGIPNEDWFVTVGGDGFKSQVDPLNPHIVYSQWQYGGLIRFDKLSGDKIDIKPKQVDSEPPLVWNWDAPLLISKFQSKKIYFASNRLFVSENRGDDWLTRSPIIGRNLDRNTLAVMDKVWGLDAVAKNQSTSIYGNITALAEGKSGELLMGTDDGLLYYSTDDGLQWVSLSLPQGMDLMCVGKDKNMVKIFPFVTSVQIASDGTMYVAYDNHRQGDFKPYIYKTNNSGKNWIRCIDGIPQHHPVKTLWSDPVDPDILCVGTEFGLFISLNKGDKFSKFGINLPPIAIKDISYQADHQDLIVATFGRGIAICDDYHLIRELKKKPAHWIAPQNHDIFIPYEKLGDKGNAFRGANRFQGNNLDEQFRVYVYIDQLPESLKEQRKKTESKQDYYPNIEQIRKEHEELLSQFYLEVSTTEGQMVSLSKVKLNKGWNTIKWDLRMSVEPFSLKSTGSEFVSGPYISPGKYKFKVFEYPQEKGSILTTFQNLTGEAEFKYLFGYNELIKPNVNRMEQWQEIKSLRKSFMIIKEGFDEFQKTVNKAIDLGPWNKQINEFDRSILLSMRNNLQQIQYELSGGDPIAIYEFPTITNIQSEIYQVYQNMSGSLQAPTPSQMKKANQIRKRLNDIEQQINRHKRSFEPIYQKWSN